MKPMPSWRILLPLYRKFVSLRSSRRETIISPLNPNFAERIPTIITTILTTLKKNFYFNKFSATWLPKPSLNNRYTTGRESIKANLTPFASSWLSPFFNHQLFREFPLTKRLKEARTSSFKNLHSQKVKNFDAITRQLESKAFCKKIKIASYQTNLSRFPNFKGNLTWTQR